MESGPPLGYVSWVGPPGHPSVHDLDHGAAASAFLYESHQISTRECTKAAKHLARRQSHLLPNGRGDPERACVL